MSPRRNLALRLSISVLRPKGQFFLPARLHHATYATSASHPDGNPGPPIRVTDLPAPNTGHIRILELNRPSARNAISRALLSSLREEVDRVLAQYDPATGDEIPPAQWNKRFGGAAGDDVKGPTRALILASAVDSCFCAGADLKERKTFTKEQTTDFLTTLRATFTSLANLPIPSIAAISSIALGGGLELALATHLRVLSANAVVGLPETRLAILPGAGGTYRLAGLVGPSRARDLVLTGRRVSAPEAYFLGLADRLVEVGPEDEEQAARWKELQRVGEEGGDGNRNTDTDAASAEARRALDSEVLAVARRAVLSEAVGLAGQMCEGGPVAIRAALRAVGQPSEEMENAMYQRVVGTEDRDEALKAFAEKRKPVYQGR